MSNACAICHTYHRDGEAAHVNPLSAAFIARASLRHWREDGQADWIARAERWLDNLIDMLDLMQKMIGQIKDVADRGLVHGNLTKTEQHFARLVLRS